MQGMTEEGGRTGRGAALARETKAVIFPFLLLEEDFIQGWAGREGPFLQSLPLRDFKPTQRLQGGRGRNFSDDPAPPASAPLAELVASAQPLLPKLCGAARRRGLGAGDTSTRGPDMVRKVKRFRNFIFRFMVKFSDGR